METLVLDRPADGVARLTLNRPEKRNAVDAGLRTALAQAVEELGQDPGIRALVLTGAGGHFSAGGDTSTMGDMDGPAARRRMKSGHRLVSALAGLDKPVVAAVEGSAFGAGASLMLLADLILAGRGARIGFPFLKIGLVPDWAMLHTLPRRVGLSRARRLIYFTETVPAPEAEAMGLVDLLCEDGAVQDEAVALAGRLAALPAHAFAATKRQFALFPTHLDAALEGETLAQSLLWVGEEFAEGLRAAREKRPPRFQRSGD